MSIFTNFDRSLEGLLEMGTNQQEGTSRSFTECCELLSKWFVYIQKAVKDNWFKELDMVNKDKCMTQHKPGDLVYLISSPNFFV